MEFFNPKNANINFVKLFRPAMYISGLLTLAAAILIFVPGLNYGIDFRGGVEAHVTFKDATVAQKDLRALLDGKLNNIAIVDFKDPTKNEFMITAQGSEEGKDSVTKVLVSTLTDKYGPQGEAWNSSKMDVVGPKVGADLKRSAILSLVYTCLLIGLYMFWRFDARFTPGVIACIFHDLLMVTGFLVLVRLEFSTEIVAALLTLAGYSVNDTVVVFDRIRELENKHKNRDRKLIVNEAINSTLSRTILTAGMTMLSCLVLFFVGGPSLHGFSLALFFGILVGTYSSVFVSAPLYIWADARFNKKVSTTTPATAKG